MLVPAAIDDHSTHSTLAESAIFPLPTFTDISLSDGFSFRFGAPKGEMAVRAISFCFCDHHFLAAAVDHLY